MSETTDPTKKKNLATSYDDKFSNPSTHVDKSWDSINKHIKDNPKSSSFEAFNASENSDYIEGWENPHTYAGGFDTNVYDPFEEIRATNQSDLNKISKIPTRISVKIAAEVAKIPGYITGLAGGIAGEISDKFTGKDEYSFTEQAFNNGWVKAVEQLNQNINEELLPVYVKKSIKEGSFWDSATSPDFWATEGADGIGFMVSMMVPGAILKGLGLGSKMMNATNKLIALGNNSSKLAKAARAVESLGMTAEKFNVFNATMANTYLEAAAEAGGAMENYEKVGKQQLIDKLQKEGYSYDEAVAQSNQQKAILGKDMFKANALLLLVPNALQSSMMFGKGASKFMSSYTTKEALKAAGKRIGKNFLSEGFIEEAGQSTVENYLSEKANKNQLKSKGVFNLDDFDPKGLKQAYLDTLTSVDGQKAIFLGGVLGSTMSVYQERKEDIQNKKNSDDVTGLTEKYDSSLRSIIETDDYKKDVNGDIVYDYNNKPIIDKESVIRKFRTIDELSDRFDEYDEALESGDTELLEKSRNKTIQDVMLPFVQKGELGIEAVDKYYDKMLESEEVQNSEEYESIKNRKSEILEIAKDVSKKYENYQNFAMSSFDIKIPVQDKTQLNLLNAVKKDYFNRLSNSYAMTEIERNQVKNKLKEVSLKIKSIEDVHKVDNPTLSTFMDDSDKKSPDENKNILAEKNSTYKKLKDYQTRLTNKLESVEKEISEGFFNNEKIQSDFTNTYSNLIKDGVFNQQTVNEEEQSESAIDSDLAEYFRNELLDKINENNQENSKVFTKEDFDEYVNELNDNLAKGFKLDPTLSELYNTLPDRKSQIDVNNEEFELDNQIKTELGEQPNETLTTQISDVENHEQTTEVNLKAEVTNSESQNTSYKNNHISNHRTLSKVEKTDESKGIKSGDKLSYVNQEWIDYENIPVDKTGTELHFSLNEKGGYNNETKLAVKLMQDILNGVPISTIVAKSKTKSLDNLRQFLADYTPLYLGFKDSQTKALLDVKLVNQNTQGEIDKNQIFLKQKEVRLQIINHILNGGKLEDISTNITAQMPGVLQIDLNEDGTVPENKITDLNYFQLNGLVDDQGNLTNKGFHEIRERLSVVADFSNLQNAKGELNPLSTKTESFRPKGEFYLEIPKANGEPFYLKLNSVKIPQTKAEVIYEIYKYRFAPEGVINKGLTLKEVAKTNPDLIELIKTELKQEYDVISKIKNQDDITLKDVIDIIIYDNNASDKVKFNFRGTGIEGQSVLEYGSNTIDNLEELENKKDELIEWITSTKRQNIKMGSPKNIGGINTNSKEYLDYLINNNILNTNAVTFDKEGNSLPTFGGYTNIYWKNLNIKNKKENEFIPASEMTNGVDIFKLTGKPAPKAPVVTKTSITQKDLLEQFEIDNNEGNVSEFTVDKVKYYFSDKTHMLLNQSTGKFVDNLEDTLKIVEKFNSSIKVKIAQKNIDNIKNSWNKFNKAETKSQSNIEDKKADIEKRRQEELNNKEEFVSSKKRQEKEGGNYKEISINDIDLEASGLENLEAEKVVVLEERGLNLNGQKVATVRIITENGSDVFEVFLNTDKINAKYDAELAALENNSENIRKSENNSVSLQESETKNVGEGSVGVESKTTDQVYLDNAKKAFIEGKINAFTMTENGLYLNTNGVRVVNGFKDNGNMDVFEASKVELTKDEKRELKQIEADREFGDEGTGERKKELAKKIFQRSLSEQSLKEQPTTSNQSDIEAKKADIEREKKLEIFLNSVDYNGNALEIVTKRYVGDKYDVIEALMKASFLDNKDKFGSILQAVKIRDTDNLTIGEKRRISKYDTELFNLKNNSENIRKSENNSVSLQNNIEFTHQIDGTEENKQVKEMESKIESKQLNLSEDKIMEFVEEDGFGLLIERYSQEKGIKEEDLTTEDYNKIIESNYTKEQIDKICKN